MQPRPQGRIKTGAKGLSFRGLEWGDFRGPDTHRETQTSHCLRTRSVSEVQEAAQRLGGTHMPATVINSLLKDNR